MDVSSSLQLIVTGSKPLLIVGRLILGMGVGIVSNCTTLYLSEIPPAHIRGTIVSGWQLFLAIGQVIGAVVAQGTKNSTTTFSYRFPIAFNFAICLIIGGGLLIVPESEWILRRYPEMSADTDRQSSLRQALVGSSPRTASMMLAMLSGACTKTTKASIRNWRSRSFLMPRPLRPASPVESPVGEIYSRVSKRRRWMLLHYSRSKYSY